MVIGVNGTSQLSFEISELTFNEHLEIRFSLVQLADKPLGAEGILKPH